MPDTMIFIMQTIRMLLKEEGPLERAVLTRRVGEQMQLGELERYIDSTIDVMIRTNRVQTDEDGKLYMRRH
jgi:hypothetical protein